jgi:hypothetical protein
MEQCSFEHMGDDGFNFHGEYYRVKSAADGRLSLEGRRRRGFRQGDRLVVYGPDFRRKTEMTVEACEEGIVVVSSSDGVAVDDVVASPDHVASGLVVRGCEFRDCRARAGLVRASDVTLEGNRAERITMSGFWIGPEIGYFVEADFPQRVTVRGNVLETIGIGRDSRIHSTQHIGAISVTPRISADRRDAFRGNRQITDIVLEGNEISDAAVCGLFISNASGVQIRENSFVRTNTLEPRDAGGFFGMDPDAAVVIRDADAIDLSGNRVSSPGPWLRRAVQVDGSADADSIDSSGMRSLE